MPASQAGRRGFDPRLPLSLEDPLIYFKNCLQLRFIHSVTKKALFLQMIPVTAAVLYLTAGTSTIPAEKKNTKK